VHARPLVRLLPLAACLAAQAPAAFAQAPNIRVAGRVQAQYRAAGGDSSGNFNTAAVNNGFEIRRLRIQTDVRFGDYISLVIQPSFEMSALRMRDAYLRVGLSPHIGITLGQEKSPFQRYELISSNNLLSIERGLRVLGLSNKEALNNLLEANGYIAHDIGAFVDWAAKDSRATIKLGVSNGSRESATDVNNAKSFFGRATAIVATNADDQPVLQVGASFAARDRARCNPAANSGTGCGATTGAYFPDSSMTTTAIGIDLEWGGYRPGWHLIADFVTGDNVPLANRVATGRNTGNVRTTADSVLRTFLGASVIAAYRIATRGTDTRLVKLVEPALRFDYLDPDTDAGDDHGILITPVLNVYFANSVVLRVGLDLYSYTDATGTGRSARELKLSWQANF
jgi:hypothetical protein